jgi:acyl-CoA thioesterase
MDLQPPSPRFPLADFIGMDVAPTGAGAATARVTAGDAHRNPHGVVHGAVLFTLVDTAMGAATMSLLDDDHWCASIDVQLRFFRPVFGGGLETTARVLHAGKRVVHLEADVRGDDSVLLAKATAAFAVLPRP